MSDVSLLSDRSLVVPLEIGQAVRHRVDPIKSGGVIIGAILKEPVRALVHWHAAPWTFEVLDDLAIDDA
jgi:hypothetical protein